MRQVLKYVGPSHNSDGQESVNHSQHVGATVSGKTNAHGRALIKMLHGWEDYAEAYQSTYDSSVGEDHVMGTYWAEIGLAIKRLLDGECGGLDCGSVAHNITSMIEAQGFKTDGYTLTEKGGA